MGSIIGSIYPLDNLVIQEKPNRFNNYINPSLANSAVQLNAWKSVMDKFGIDSTVDLTNARASELNSRKRKIKDALKVANEDERKWLNVELDKVQDRLKEISSSTWNSIWDGLVNLSGAKPQEQGQDTPTTSAPTQTIEEPEKKSNTLLYVGIGVGALALIGTVVYFINKNK